jgi:hypothetical protein
VINICKKYDIEIRSRRKIKFFPNHLNYPYRRKKKNNVFPIEEMSFLEKKILMDFNFYLKNIDFIKFKNINNNNIDFNNNDSNINDINNDIKKRIFLVDKSFKMTKDPNVCFSNCIYDFINNNNININEEALNSSSKNFCSINNYLFNNNNNKKNNKHSSGNFNNNNNIQFNFNENKYFNISNNNYSNNYIYNNDNIRISSFIENDINIRMKNLENLLGIQNFINIAFQNSTNILK